jgi:hypothetical protein
LNLICNMRLILVILFFLATSSCYCQLCFPQIQDKIQDYIDTSYYSNKANFFQSIESNVYLATSSPIVDKIFFDIPFDYSIPTAKDFCNSVLRVELVDNSIPIYTKDYTPSQYKHIFWTNFPNLLNQLVVRIDLSSIDYQSLFADYVDESLINYAEKKYKLYVYSLINGQPTVIYGDKPTDVSLKFIKHER